MADYENAKLKLDHLLKENNIENESQDDQDEATTQLTVEQLLFLESGNMFSFFVLMIIEGIFSRGACWDWKRHVRNNWHFYFHFACFKMQLPYFL